MKLDSKELYQLIYDKFEAAGVSRIDNEIASEILTWADRRGIHSHGAVRMEYYIERIMKGGINKEAKMTFEKTGSAAGILHGENGFGFRAAKLGIDEAIKLASETGIAAVGIREISHSGAIGYYTEYAAAKGYIALSVCQSDPMAVPFGGAEPFFGTNPIAFAAPGNGDDLFSLDMATTTQAWGKVLVAREKHEKIPLGWAVDAMGNPTEDALNVHALLPIAGPKGYALMMMVDVLAGVLLDLPSGQNVSSMYHDLTTGRNLGQFHIVIDPEKFCSTKVFKERMSALIENLHNVKPASGFDGVKIPGEIARETEARYLREGIEIEQSIYDYLNSDQLDNNKYNGKNRFAE